jgi:hypothetical protein
MITRMLREGGIVRANGSCGVEAAIEVAARPSMGSTVLDDDRIICQALTERMHGVYLWR